ncbi:hypothetical protein F3J23_07630 [Chryseobacterium sp. Tr-659]|uniref:hypothetical protein n=1 Tax=Chryseobacterium sp. Tr-659 TaxID=2608340 RepID=UPI00141DAA97|nr:hypothetical protein [Chryseobacterium sp. Tr-659]NIF05309.1 hypothetical protein [Chryseobacterium sp. Tr-659]
MKKIIYGMAMSISFTAFAFASSPTSPTNYDENVFEEVTPVELCCHTADVYVGNVNYGSVTSCAGTCQAAQDNWNSIRQQVIKAVEKNESLD